MNRTQWHKRSGRSSTDWIAKSTRFAIYHRDHFDCHYCRCMFPPAYDGVGLTLDHIVPRSLGGSNAPDNLATACGACNYGRRDKPLSGLELRRALRQGARPLDRGVGAVYASIAIRGLVHPLTLRKVYFK